jgi:hypothetical protein
MTVAAAASCQSQLRCRSWPVQGIRARPEGKRVLLLLLAMLGSSSSSCCCLQKAKLLLGSAP